MGYKLSRGFSDDSKTEICGFAFCIAAYYCFGGTVLAVVMVVVCAIISVSGNWFV